LIFNKLIAFFSLFLLVRWRGRKYRLRRVFCPLLHYICTQRLSPYTPPFRVSTPAAGVSANRPCANVRVG